MDKVKLQKRLDEVLAEHGVSKDTASITGLKKSLSHLIDEYVAGVKWTSVNYDDEKSLPPLNRPVLCSLEWSSGKRVYAVLKRVEEDDVTWRTVDDDSEIDYSVKVIQCQAIDDISRRAGIGEKDA